MRRNTVGSEGRRAHAARWEAKISATTDPSRGASTYTKELRRKNRRAVVRLDSRLILFDANERLKGGCMKYRAQIISFPVAPGGLGLHTC